MTFEGVCYGRWLTWFAAPLRIPIKSSTVVTPEKRITLQWYRKVDYFVTEGQKFEMRRWSSLRYMITAMCLTQYQYPHGVPRKKRFLLRPVQEKALFQSFAVAEPGLCDNSPGFLLNFFPSWEAVEGLLSERAVDFKEDMVSGQWPLTDILIP